MRTPVTQVQIAREAGVSQAVVSAVLAGRVGKIGAGEDVRRRVHEAAARLGYKVDSSARSLRSGKFASIGYAVTVSHQVEFDFPLTRMGVATTASDAGYRVVMVKLPAAGDPGEDDLPAVLREQHLDGLIIHHAKPFSAGLQSALADWGGPTVHINAKSPAPSVWLDDIAGGRAITRHLIDSGFQNIAFIRTWPDRKEHYSDTDRVAGYEQAMKKARLVPRVFTAGVWKFDQSREDFFAWQKKHPPIDAFFCYSDADVGALQQWLIDSPRRLFKDIAVAGYDDVHDWQRIFSGELTTTRTHRLEMAAAATRLLIERIDSPDNKRLAQQSIRFEPELVVRKSTTLLRRHES